MFDVLTYGASVVGGLALAVGAFTESGRAAPRWTRLAPCIAGPAGVVWGVLGYFLLLGYDDTANLVRQFKTFFGGVAVGILVLLFSSGEFRTSVKTDTKRQ